MLAELAIYKETKMSDTKPAFPTGIRMVAVLEIGAQSFELSVQEATDVFNTLFGKCVGEEEINGKIYTYKVEEPNLCMYTRRATSHNSQSTVARLKKESLDTY